MNGLLCLHTACMGKRWFFSNQYELLSTNCSVVKNEYRLSLVYSVPALEAGHILERQGP